MINFKDIQARARDMYAARFEPEGIRPLADIYWRSLLVTACALVVLALMYGMWDLFGVLNVLASAPDTSPPPPASLNRAVLSGIVQKINSRQTRFNDFGTNPPPAIQDPSK